MLLPLATDWAATISSLATGAGTLVLAIATFASVRSAQRSARVAELALHEQRRPVLANSRLEDPVQKIMFVERKWVRAGGSRAVAEYENGVVYLALSLRNVGSGIAVCQGWTVTAGFVTSREQPEALAIEQFRTQSRDLFIAPADVGMWQGALRDPQDPRLAETAAAIEGREPITIELLYTDQVGESRTITRFGLAPMTWEDGEETWLASTSRHWFLDEPGPRPESQVREATEAILRLQEERDQANEAEANAAEAGAGNGGPPAASGDEPGSDGDRTPERTGSRSAST